MATEWRQGDLLSPEDAIALGVIEPSQRDTHRVMVISHSCDIANSVDCEPVVEVTVGDVRPMGDTNPKAQNGHSIRRLDLRFPDEPDGELVAFRIDAKKGLSKPDVLDCTPWPERVCSTRQRRVLSRWLAQRYSRSAFPTDFNDWLRDRLKSKHDTLIGEHSSSVVAVYFDLDNGEDIKHADPDEPYTLGIEVVYDTSSAENATSAGTLADELTKLFTSHFKPQGAWRWIELVYCKPVADTAFSLRAANELCRYRLEHFSAFGEPMDESE